MKWLSVKKYRPICNTLCIFRLENSKIELGYKDDIGYIVLGKTDGYDGEYLKNVTHFCIPDAIEIEEDE